MLSLKKHLLFFIVICLISIVKGQNLVVNPSFEITNTNCANFGGEGFRQDLNPSWDNANSNVAGDSCSSPDLFSACNLFVNNMPGGGLGSLGTQYSRTGSRHVGIITYDPLSSYREYIQGQTTTPLIAGQVYCVSMYVSLADEMPYATNNIGVYFANTRYLRDACTQGSLINVTPQLNTSCVITDTTSNWVRLQWNYTAVGGEQFFTIGNFFNNAGTTIVNTGKPVFPNPYAYYFIDDVSVVANSCCYADIISTSSQCVTNTSAITLTATPGLGASCSQALSGTWSGTGITNPTTGAFNPSVAGVGVHVITFSLSCGYTATTSIAVSPCSSLTVCKETNGSLTVSNGVAPYSWSVFVPASSTPITNQTQCQACGYTWLGFTSQCLNGIVPATSCTTAATWSVYATGTTALPPVSATQVVVTDAAGTTLTVTPASVPNCSTTSCPTLSLSVSSQTNVNCFGANTGSATVSVSGGTGPYTYTWVPGNLSGSSQTGLAAGVYTINVRDVNLCTGTRTLSITQPTAALNGVISSTTASSCGANNGSASITANGGTPAYTYSWIPNGGSGVSASNLSSGNNTVVITDSKGCSQSITIFINSVGGPTVTVNSQLNVNCFGANTGSATVIASGGTNPYTYTWSPGNLLGASQTGLTAGNYTVNVSDANQCVGLVTISISQPSSSLSVNINTNPPSCGLSDGSATVTATGATGPYTYTWSTGSNNASISGIAAGSYSVLVSDANGCQLTSSININSVGSASLSIVNTTDATCSGINDGSATISATGGLGTYTYTWLPSGGNSATATGLASGAYTVNVSDGNCTSSIIVVIGQLSSFTVNAGPTVVIQQGETTVLSASGPSDGNYSWTPSGSVSCSTCSVTTASPNQTTTYTLTVTNSQGCVSFDTVTVIVDVKCGDLFIPSAFTPNDDGMNDVLFVMGSCITNLTFVIFNRWGEKVFETSDPAIGWDGTFQGKKMNPAVFAYYLRATVNGEDVKLNGSISIVK